MCQLETGAYQRDLPSASALESCADLWHTPKGVQGGEWGTHQVNWWNRSFSSVAQSCPTLCDPWTATRQASLSITNSCSLLKLMSIESVMPSNHLILCSPLLLLPSIFPGIGVFSNELVLRIWWPMYWSFSLSISPSSEYSGLISFWRNWLDLLAVQGTLKRLLQHHSSKASVLQCLLLGRKAMTNLDSILKSNDIAIKSPSGQSYGFSSSHVWMWELDYKDKDWSHTKTERGWSSVRECEAF